jgi:hypothetical protein
MTGSDGTLVVNAKHQIQLNHLSAKHATLPSVADSGGRRLRDVHISNSLTGEDQISIVTFDVDGQARNPAKTLLGALPFLIGLQSSPERYLLRYRMPRVSEDNLQ